MRKGSNAIKKPEINPIKVLSLPVQESDKKKNRKKSTKEPEPDKKRKHKKKEGNGIKARVAPHIVLIQKIGKGDDESAKC
jgi:hypothetical protein